MMVMMVFVVMAAVVNATSMTTDLHVRDDCPATHTCADGTVVPYCEKVENYDSTGTLIGAGCKCVNSLNCPKTDSVFTPVSVSGGGGGQGSDSDTSGDKDTFEFVAKIGGDGSSTFNAPIDVAVDSNDNIYITDKRNNRVAIYDDDYQYVDEFEDLEDASDITIKDDLIYVVYDNTKFKVFNTDGTVELEVETHAALRGIAVDAEGKIYLSKEDNSNTEGNMILIYDADGNLEDSFHDEAFGRPSGIEVDNENNLYVCNYINDVIAMYDADFNLVAGITGRGLGIPVDVEVVDGLIYMLEKGNMRVEVFDLASGDYVGTIAGNGRGDDNNQLNVPTGIGVKDNTIYVANYGNHRLSIFQRISDVGGQGGPGSCGEGAVLENGMCVVTTSCPVGCTCEDLGPEGFASTCPIETNECPIGCTCDGDLVTCPVEPEEVIPEEDVPVNCPVGCVVSGQTCSCPAGVEPECSELCVWDGSRCACEDEVVMGCDGCMYGKKCYFSGYRLDVDKQPNYCGEDDKWHVQTADGESCQNAHTCQSNICENGVCGKSCDGCKEGDECLPFGTRQKDDTYCSLDKVMTKQKTESDSCSNNYECLTNVCVDSQCVSRNFIQKIFAWFGGLFG